MSIREDINKMIGNSQGFLRTNRFKVTITPPQELLSSSLNDFNDRIILSAAKASIPGWTSENVKFSQGGRVPDTLANSLVFNETTVEFYVSKDLFEHQFFESWRDLMIDPDSNRLGYHDDYKGNMQIIPTRSNNSETGLKVFQYNNIHPTTVGDVDMSFADENTVGKLTVAFQYRNTTIEDVQN